MGPAHEEDAARSGRIVAAPLVPAPDRVPSSTEPVEKHGPPLRSLPARP